MPIASTTLAIADGGLGVSRQLSRPPAIVGCAQSGTVDTVVLCSTIEDALSTFGYGKLTALAAEYFLRAGGPILCVRATSTSAGSCSAVSAGGSNTSTAVLSVTVATAADDFRVVYRVTRAGANLAALTAAVRISLDSGESFSTEFAVPANGEITIPNTGITTDFADGTFVVGDTFTFTSTAPIWDASALGTALDALEVTTIDHEFVHVAEQVTGATVGTLDTSVGALEASNVYRWFLASSRNQTSGESVSTWQGVLLGTSPGFSAFTSRHGAVAAGYATRLDALWDANLIRSVAWAIGPRLALIRSVGVNGLADHPGRVLSGPLGGIDDGDLIHDLRILTGLDTGRFIGAQSLPGRGGFYSTAVTRAAAGSDFTSVMNVRVVKEAARLSVSILQDYLNSSVRTIAGGKIDPRDADAIDGRVTAALAQDLVASGLTSAVSAQVDRNNNVLSSSQLNFKVRVQPLGYATLIDIDLSLSAQVA